MKITDKIKSLIEEYKLRKQECESELEEVYKVDETKLSEEDKNAIKGLRIKLGEELSLRGLMVNDLEYLLEA